MKLNELYVYIMNSLKYIYLLSEHEQEIELRKIVKIIFDFKKNNFNQIHGVKFKKICKIIEQLKLRGIV